MLTPLFPANAAPPAGPYSPAMDCGDFVFCSGQIALDINGKMQNETFEDEVLQVLKNVESLIIASGKTKKDVIKSTVFLTNLNDFSVMNELYAEFFENHKPARSTIQVAALPLNAKVEIEIIIKK